MRISIQHTIKWACLLLTLLLSIPALAAGPLKVTGRVVDTNGEVLIGVTIKEKGTDASAVTDVNGNYTITCKSAHPVLSTLVSSHWSQRCMEPCAI